MSTLTIPSQRNAIEGYDTLEELALNFIWLWNGNHCAEKIWKQLDPDLWEHTRNPWTALQTVSTEQLERVLSDPEFRRTIAELLENYRKESSVPAWFQNKYPKTSIKKIAYFSMEYMLGEALPIYSGGLGNVAGDQLKAASDLGVAIVGIGLLYQQGYFRQVIDKDGNQHAFYPFNSPGQLPIRPLRRENGEWLRIKISAPGWPIWIRAWEVKVGRVKLYLLDSNDPENYPPNRGITSELYGGDSELRLKQELILGIGGIRLLHQLGIDPDICHLNEGHAAFAVLARAKIYMEHNKVPFEVALEVTKAGNLFTTHTAVSAGFDRFSPALIEQYLSDYAVSQLKISMNDLLALGRMNPNDPAESFNMAYLAIRGSGAVNAVSGLHGKVSRKLFAPLFPNYPESEIPIGHVTNGVHMPSWGSIEANELWGNSCGKSCWMGSEESLEKRIREVPDASIWKMRNVQRKNLINFSRDRLTRILAARGESEEVVAQAKDIFDPNTLTLGFARRFATYKRPNLLLHDPDRLLRILTNPKRPVQLIIAGKAHPADKPGQALIQQWSRFIARPEARKHVIFITDYDVLVSEHLVRGVDLWINTPRRPWEACGTSGMKILVNGGINLSELDGWWVEAYTPEVGWALGDGNEHGEDSAWDAAEADALYRILENEVIPEFYTRDSEGIPSKWIAKMRESMARLTPHYSSDRAVRQYTDQYYIPGAELFQNRSADNALSAKKIIQWQRELAKHWPAVRFGDVKVNSNGTQHVFEVQVYLDDLGPDKVEVELYADPTDNRSKVYHKKMDRIKELPGVPGMHVYKATVQTTRPASHFTPRILPYLAGAAVPLEANQILWQK